MHFPSHEKHERVPRPHDQPLYSVSAPSLSGWSLLSHELWHYDSTSRRKSHKSRTRGRAKTRSSSGAPLLQKLFPIPTPNPLINAIPRKPAIRRHLPSSPPLAAEQELREPPQFPFQISKRAMPDNETPQAQSRDQTQMLCTPQRCCQANKTPCTLTIRA